MNRLPMQDKGYDRTQMHNFSFKKWSCEHFFECDEKYSEVKWSIMR